MHLLSSAGILALLAVAGAVAQQPTPPPTVVSSEEAALWPKDEIAHHACRVYRTNCYKCHRVGGFAEDVMDYIMDRDQLVARKKITPNDLKRSMAYQLPKNGDMPPDAALSTPEPNLMSKYVTDQLPSRKLTADEILGIWVLAGAPAWETTGTGNLLSCK